MATLWFKDDALLIDQNALSIADQCCCGLGGFYDCGSHVNQTDLNAIDITSEAPLTLSERIITGYTAMPVELGLLYERQLGDKHFAYGVASDWKTAYARYYNGSTWSNASTGLPSGVTYSLQHRHRGTGSTINGIALLNGMHEKGQSGKPAMIFTNVRAQVAGADVGDTTYFNKWNGSSWTATTHQFTKYGDTRYHVEQVADYYKPGRWAMGIIFEASLSKMHYVFNGSLTNDPPGLGTNAWRVNSRVPVALDDTHLWTLSRNLNTLTSNIYKYNTSAGTWALHESTSGTGIQIRGMTVTRSGKWYGLGGSVTNKSFLYKNSLTTFVELPNMNPKVPESIYTVGKYVVVPRTTSPFGHHLYNTDTDTLTSIAGSGWNIKAGMGSLF